MLNAKRIRADSMSAGVIHMCVTREGAVDT